MAWLVATRATCPRRAVGCVLVDEHNHVMATGYNGVPRGFPHCIDTPCPGASHLTGQGLDACLATHAEQNALLQCSNVEAIHTVYCTTSPCIHCIKLLLNTGAQALYVSSTYSDPRPLAMWKPRLWIEIPKENL